MFDDGPHVSFTKDERIQGILADAVEGDYQQVPIGLDNHWRGQILTHPLQVNLHGLPTDVVVPVLVDLARAHAHAEGAGDDTPPADYETWLRRAYGDTFAETFPMTYGRKYHTTEMANLTTDWVGPRMYRPSLAEALQGALEPSPVREKHYVTHFRYPSHGGYAAYIARWAAGAAVHLSHEVTAIDPGARTVSFADGRTAAYDRLISSVPLPDLVPRIVGAPADVVAAAARLAWTSVVLVNLGVDRPGIGGDTHIRYIYDADIPFSRISFPHRLSPHVVPAGASAIQVEWYSSEKYQPLAMTPDEHIAPIDPALAGDGPDPLRATASWSRRRRSPGSRTSSTITTGARPWRPSRRISPSWASTAAAATASGTTSGRTRRSAAASSPRTPRSSRREPPPVAEATAAANRPGARGRPCWSLEEPAQLTWTGPS